MRTPLYSHHLALGGKMVPFAGWEMPVHYKGVLTEHQAVREKVGLFDVSHMGRIEIQGPDAELLLEEISTNRIQGKPNRSVTYTVWCYPEGGSVDDLMIYKIDSTHFFIIANASNRDKDLLHLGTQAQLNRRDVKIKEKFSGEGILALQGPEAGPLLSSLIPEVSLLKPMHFLEKGGLFISRTGYTGAGGFEIMGSDSKIIEWWEKLLEQGKPFGIQPIGLGARDTLRLEMGFALYGHELTDAISPLESVSAWTVKEDKNFLGKEALLKKKSVRYAYAIRLEVGIPRVGNSIIKNDQVIGEVTSGTFSPTLEKGIALILVNTPLKTGDEVTVQIRQTLCPACVADLPFVRKTI